MKAMDSARNRILNSIEEHGLCFGENIYWNKAIGGRFLIFPLPVAVSASGGRERIHPVRNLKRRLIYAQRIPKRPLRETE